MGCWLIDKGQVQRPAEIQKGSGARGISRGVWDGDAGAEGLFERLVRSVRYSLPTASLGHHRYEPTNSSFHFSAILNPSQGLGSGKSKARKISGLFLFSCSVQPSSDKRRYKVAYLLEERKRKRRF